MNDAEKAKMLAKIPVWSSNFLGLIEAWKTDKDFQEVYPAVAKRKGLHLVRCYMIHQYLTTACRLEGNVAEVGVWHGKTGKLITLTANKFGKHAYLFDTFEGMPQHDVTKDPRYRLGQLKSDYDDVKKFLSDCNNVTISKGIFPANSDIIKDEKLVFAHIDVDIYQSTKDCTEFLYPRMVSGGIMVYDDPGFADCKGAKTAVDEFYADKPENMIYLLTGQSIIIKH